MQKRKGLTTVNLVFTAMMVALVMASNYLRVQTSASALHVANAVCLLAGMMFGGLQGGIVAGLGSALYDMTNPVYISEAWITFLTKGIMALVCGLFVSSKHVHWEPRRKLVAGATLGAIVYIVLYLVKSYVQLRWVRGNPLNTIPPQILEKFFTSAVNGLFAVIVAPLLYQSLMPALHTAGLSAHFPNSPRI